jgi:hypothetical protein
MWLLMQIALSKTKSLTNEIVPTTPSKGKKSRTRIATPPSMTRSSSALRLSTPSSPINKNMAPLEDDKNNSNSTSDGGFGPRAFVWCKFSSHPWWPCRVLRAVTATRYTVLTFGDHSVSTVDEKSMRALTKGVY